MADTLAIGLAATVSATVSAEHLAARWASGELQVLATPQVIAFMENASWACVEPHLPPGHTTVGGRVEMRHTAPTPLGAHVTARSELVSIDRRKLTFRIMAYDEAGQIAHGEHDRHIIETGPFLESAKARRSIGKEQ